MRCSLLVSRFSLTRGTLVAGTLGEPFAVVGFLVYSASVGMPM